ncbi:fibronectin type III domain-containing protein [Neolewinella agarilytica]|uniref:Chitodextrinase n=1 Tax=Neolewinella agarilytica TaxID=478744 RepID=A0A1H9FQE3_9BACT|nr:hypothetical protein [Neolewinella agarilytica]SEQ40122.1 Chitodextrinase [Neolewinella agarilytica]
MQNLLRSCFTLLFFFTLAVSFAQINVRPSGSSGSGYPAILAAGLDYEDPDCVHTTFGPHITQHFDELLQRNVFRFHSHIEEDNDRCRVFDRVRMEIKGGPNTNPEAQHLINTSSWYRWKFKLPADFVGTSSFCHIFQNKLVGGEDAGLPILTLTARASVLQFSHRGGETGTDLGVLTQADLDLFRGRWVEVYLRQLHAEAGEVELNIRDLSTGETILAYENNNIDLWRTGGQYDRPKWGIYRSKSAVLKDETADFADFCISESSAALCPPEPTLIADTEAPTSPQNLVASEVMIASLNLSWDAATDNIGVDAYRLFQDGTEVWSGQATSTTVSGLRGSTTYDFSVRAIDPSGNVSGFSDTLSVTTTDSTALPGLPGSPFPGDGATNQNTEATLRWSGGDNTVSYNVYFGTETDPPLVRNQSGTSYVPDLAESTTYYWRIGGVNDYGETLSPLWTFTTGTGNTDAPWYLFRGNARPEEEGDLWELNNAPDAPIVDATSTDPAAAENSFYSFHDASGDNFRWRYRYTESDTSITVVARFKAISPEVDGISFFEIRGFGWREKVRINQSSVRLERSVSSAERALPFDLSEDFHVIRITMSGPNVTVYLDEDPEPFLMGISAEENTSEFFEWGKSSGQEYGATIDWIAVTVNGEYAPGEGAELPEDLVLSRDAALSEITIDEVPIDTFAPDVTTYYYDFSSGELPLIDFQTRSALASTEVMMEEGTSSIIHTISVTAEDGITKRDYVVVVIFPLSSEDPAFATVQLFPNPVESFLQVDMGDLSLVGGEILLYESSGRFLRSYQLNGEPRLDLSGVKPGLHTLLFQLADGRSFARRVTIR